MESKAAYCDTDRFSVVLGYRRKKKTVFVPFSPPCPPYHYAVMCYFLLLPKHIFPSVACCCRSAFGTTHRIVFALKTTMNSRQHRSGFQSLECRKGKLHTCVSTRVIQSVSQTFHCVCLSCVLTLSRSRGPSRSDVELCIWVLCCGTSSLTGGI